MQAGIIQLPDTDMGINLERAILEIYETKANCFQWSDETIKDVDVVFLSSGALWYEFAMNENIEVPIINALKRFSSAGGLVIGFGEGFRLLCMSGLLPGKFILNKQGKAFTNDVYIKVDNSKTPITTLVDKTGYIKLPMSTIIGQYTTTERELILMHQYHQIIYRFCNEAGRISETVNYTGSVDNIAGVCNETGSVYGILPYPDRAVDQRFGNESGRLIFESVLAEFS